MNKIIKTIFTESELIAKPPVLIDIGASEQIHKKWKQIAKYSICVAFEADQRDFQFIEKENSKFRKLYVYNSIAIHNEVNKAEFFLTKSPYCSSVLKPDLQNLKSFLHSDLFEIEKKVELKAIHLQTALNNVKLDYVDWFKTDSQGIDLRLFKALDEKIYRKVLLAEFEPGIINAYVGEDKLYSTLNELTNSGFWLSEIKIKGIPRLPKKIFDSEFKTNILKTLVKESIKKAPGWGEMTFINSFEHDEFDRREYILCWLFCTLEGHHSFAFVLAGRGLEKFNYNLFDDLKSYSKNKMKSEVYRLKFLPSAIELIKKKFLK